MATKDEAKAKPKSRSLAGSIINRGKNKYLVRVYLGIDPLTNKREYFNETVHGNKQAAVDSLAKALRNRSKGILAPGVKRATIDPLLDELLRDYRINGKDVQWASLLVEKQLRPLFGKMPAARLTTQHIHQYIDKRRAAGRANATINHELSLLRRAFNLALQSDPPQVGRVPKIPKLAENNVREGFFEHSEYLALRAELPGEIRPILTFGYYTGCRKGEILGLRWSQVDLDAGMVRLEPGTTKNKEARLIPLDGELLETIRLQMEIRDARYPDCQWVFFRDGKRIVQFKNGWAAACHRAGLWEGDETTGRPTRLFHDLRRTGVRNLLRAGNTEKIAMRISGHKTREVFDRYNITDERDLKAAMKKVASFHREAAAPAHRENNPHTIRTQRPEKGILN